MLVLSLCLSFKLLHNLCENPKNTHFSRTTTLNDIYRNMGLNQKLNEERKLRRQDQFIEDPTDYKEEYEEGDVTGFMVEKPLQSGAANDVSSTFHYLISFQTRSHGKTKLNC